MLTLNPAVIADMSALIECKRDILNIGGADLSATFKNFREDYILNAQEFTRTNYLSKVNNQSVRPSGLPELWCIVAFYIASHFKFQCESEIGNRFRSQARVFSGINFNGTGIMYVAYTPDTRMAGIYTPEL